MSNESKFKIGDKVSRRKNDGCFVGSPTSTVVVAEPDDGGYIVVKNDGEYFTVFQDDYELAVTRYVVEIRVPREGESFIYGNTTVRVAQWDHGTVRPVIVQELS